LLIYGVLWERSNKIIITSFLIAIFLTSWRKSNISEGLFYNEDLIEFNFFRGLIFLIILWGIKIWMSNNGLAYVKIWQFLHIQFGCIKMILILLVIVWFKKNSPPHPARTHSIFCGGKKLKFSMVWDTLVLGWIPKKFFFFNFKFFKKVNRPFDSKLLN